MEFRGKGMPRIANKSEERSGRYFQGIPYFDLDVFVLNDYADYATQIIVRDLFLIKLCRTVYGMLCDCFHITIVLALL